MARKNPVEEFLGEKEKLAAIRAEQDLQDWSRWDQGGRKPEDLEPLMRRYNPLFGRRTRDWKAPEVPAPVFKAELQKQFIMAAHNFKPVRQVSFNTYMQSRLQKAKRLNQTYQNVGKIPEDPASHIGRIDEATNTLQSNFGREPTNQEVSDYVNQEYGLSGKRRLTARKVRAIEEMRRKDVSSSQFQTSPTQQYTTWSGDVLRMAKKRPEEYFTGRELPVFMHFYGLRGMKKIERTKDLAKELGTSQSTIAKIKGSIGKKLQGQ
jgi:DNA-directed RNA polymerase specialized sigma subunit